MFPRRAVLISMWDNVNIQPVFAFPAHHNQKSSNLIEKMPEEILQWPPPAPHKFSCPSNPLIGKKQKVEKDKYK